MIRISIQEAKGILQETLHFLLNSNSEFEAARHEAANDMLKYMRIVFPITACTQRQVLAKYGYNAQDDLVSFTRLVKELERHDSELARLNAQLRQLVIPHMDIVRPPTNGVRTDA